MNITVTVGNFCPGGNHLPVTIAALGKSKTLIFLKDDFTDELTIEDVSEIEDSVKSLIIAFVKKKKTEGNYTWQQIKAFVEGETFIL